MYTYIMKYTTKQIIIGLLAIIIIGSLSLYIIKLKDVEEVVIKENVVDNNTVDDEINKSIEMCYYFSKKTDVGFYDVSWIKIKIEGDKVTGEFKNLPAESDSKVGTFAGTVGPLDQSIMGRHANVWWDSLAEGMEVKEELLIDFGDGSASVGFGEMVDRGDGVYVYKDKTKLFYPESMSQIDCDSLDEKIAVETYIKDNIATISKEKAVLGGTWYVVSIFVNPQGNTADVTSEDGHIQNKTVFNYNYNKETGDISVN